MKRPSATVRVWSGAHKWFTGIVTTCAALLALAVNARNLGLTPWLGLLNLNYADHAANRLMLSPRADTLRALGDTTMLTATVLDAHGASLAGATLRWTSLDTTIATVDSGGAVVARAPGRTAVEVRVREVRSRTEIVVRQLPASLVLAGDTALRLADGDTATPHAIALDARGHRVLNLTPRWESPDSLVLRVDSAGLVQALAPGRAYLWAAAGELRTRMRVDVELRPTALVLQSGEGQRGTAGRRLPSPVLLVVRGRAGQPVPGAAVRFSADDDAGSAEPVSAMSDADGRVRTEWTLSPRAGMQHLTARVAGVDSALTVSAEADPVPGNLRIEVTSAEPSGAAGAELGQPVTIRVTDTIGLALGLVRLGWSTLDGGSVTGSARTDSAGIAQAYWTLGRRAGRQRLLVQVGHPRMIAPTEVRAMAVAGPPSALVVESGAGQRSAAGSRLSRPIVVLVRDSSGNPVAGAELALEPASGAVEDSTISAGQDGRASFRWTLGTTPGPERLRVRLVSGGAAVQVSATAVPGAPATLDLATRPPGHTAQPTRVIATVRDRLGNAVPGAVVRFSASAGRLASTGGQSDSAGQRVALWTPATRSTRETRLSAMVVGTRLSAARTVPASPR